jgi:hypothetical protein
MKKSDPRQPAENPNCIPGIYNYCDRWCERCAFTDRCTQYAMERAQRQQSGRSPEGRDTFWKNLEASLALTEERLVHLANAHGVNLEERELQTPGHEPPSKRRARGQPPLAKAAGTYSDMVDDWFKDGEAALRDKEEEILAQEKLGVGGVKEEIASLTDVVEILRWYQYQIQVKLLRGLDGKSEDTGTNDLPTDSDGSAKVALIAMDRSIAAWMRMREFFPGRAESILNLLIHLDRLRRAAEKEFPKARRFVRPGFDTEDASK